MAFVGYEHRLVGGSVSWVCVSAECGFSSLGDLPDPGIEPGSPALQVDSLLSGIFLQCKRPGFSPWVGKIPWIREWQPTPVFLPREFHGQRSLAGYSPWGRRHD